MKTTNCSTLPVIAIFAAIAAWTSTEIHAIRPVVVSPIPIPAVLARVHRGGDLCVDNEGNFFSPKQQTKPTRRKPAVEEQLRGGAEQTNHRLGGLCVDTDGNFYSATAAAPSFTTVQQQEAVLGLRGGSSGLLVDKEGNFYTPLATVSPTPYAPIWMQEPDKAGKAQSSNRRRRAPSSQDNDNDNHYSRMKLARHKIQNKQTSNNKKKNNKELNFIHDHNVLMET